MTRHMVRLKSHNKSRRGGLAAFHRSISGNIVLVFGLAAVVLAVAGGGAMDYAKLLSVRQDMQAAADAAALAAARELYVMKGSDAHVRAVAESMVASTLAVDDAINSYKTDAKIDRNRDTVTTNITSKPQVYFSSLVGVSDPTVSVNATAQILGSGRICVIALETSKAHVISLEKSARVTARKCSVFSNSSHKNGIKAHNTSRLTAEMICSAGGIQGSQANFAPKQETDCPVLADPLADRPAPPYSGCTKTNWALSVVKINPSYAAPRSWRQNTA